MTDTSKPSTFDTDLHVLCLKEFVPRKTQSLNEHGKNNGHKQMLMYNFVPLSHQSVVMEQPEVTSGIYRSWRQCMAPSMDNVPCCGCSLLPPGPVTSPVTMYLDLHANADLLFLLFRSACKCRSTVFAFLILFFCSGHRSVNTIT